MHDHPIRASLRLGLPDHRRQVALFASRYAQRVVWPRAALPPEPDALLRVGIH